jgi:hypothetical protein
MVVAHLTTSYLAGNAEPVKVNFLAGQENAVLTLPRTAHAGQFVLKREGMQVGDPITVENTQHTLPLLRATTPGNYLVEVVGEEGKGSVVGGVSLNVPGEESSLRRVPVEDVEGLLGKGSVVSVETRTDLREALRGQWQQPLELFPYLLIALLFVLAVENLLANKFYRREPEANG